jgi:hypothetical protein
MAVEAAELAELAELLKQPLRIMEVPVELGRLLLFLALR